MSEYVYDSTQVNGLIVNVINDREPENPIAGHPLCRLIISGPIEQHSDRALITEVGQYRVALARSDKALADAVQRRYPGALVQTVYFYQHSGLALDTESFQGRVPGGHYEFDCGVAGIVVATKDAIRKFYGTNDSAKVWDQAKQLQREKVRQLAAYCNGDVYGWELVRPTVACEEDEQGNHWCNDADEYLDSCGGYYDIQSALAAGVEEAKQWND